MFDFSGKFQSHYLYIYNTEKFLLKEIEEL